VAAARSAKIAIVFAGDNGIANTDLVNSLAPNEDALIDIGSCRAATEGIRYLFVRSLRSFAAWREVLSLF
jgi:hypothetical protein